MTNWHRTALLRLLKLSDLAVIGLAFAAAVGFATPGEESWLKIFEMRVKVGNVLFVAAYLGYCHLVLHGLGLYLSHRLSPSSREWRDLGAATLLAAVPLWFTADLLRFSYATPTFLAAFAIFTFAGLGVERRVLRMLARGIRRHGRNLRHVVIVACDDRAFELTSRLAKRGDLGYHVVTIVEVPSGPRLDPALASIAFDRIAAAVARHPVDEVFLSLPLDTAQSLIRDVVALCEEQGITVRLLSTVVDLVLARAQIDELDGRPVITIFTGPPDSLRLLAKRMIDMTVSTVLLLVSSPMLLLVAAVIKLDSKGSAFFVQERVGLGGRRFHFFKFRTMVEGAEQMQESLEPLNEADGPVFKIRNDPRVTRSGRWIRRLSLDELPQLWNVLKGDMSLVGPRPLPLRDVARIEARAHKRRFSVKPGITCLWQVNGREPEFSDWIRTDMEYIDNWSLGLDVKILLRTIPAVLSGRGAY